eukprot:m.268210 g.268210  ORF g.268210 m.268210 type:complete len:822 (-) comp22806_c6_seq5:363-2828(-)
MGHASRSQPVSQRHTGQTVHQYNMRVFQHQIVDHAISTDADLRAQAARRTPHAVYQHRMGGRQSGTAGNADKGSVGGNSQLHDAGDTSSTALHRHHGPGHQVAQLHSLLLPAGSHYRDMRRAGKAAATTRGVVGHVHRRGHARRGSAGRGIAAATGSRTPAASPTCRVVASSDVRSAAKALGAVGLDLLAGEGLVAQGAFGHGWAGRRQRQKQSVAVVAQRGKEGSAVRLHAKVQHVGALLHFVSTEQGTHVVTAPAAEARGTIQGLGNTAADILAERHHTLVSLDGRGVDSGHQTVDDVMGRLHVARVSFVQCVVAALNNVGAQHGNVAQRIDVAGSSVRCHANIAAVQRGVQHTAFGSARNFHAHQEIARRPALQGPSLQQQAPGLRLASGAAGQQHPVSVLLVLLVHKAGVVLGGQRQRGVGHVRAQRVGHGVHKHRAHDRRHGNEGKGAAAHAGQLQQQLRVQVVAKAKGADRGHGHVRADVLAERLHVRIHGARARTLWRHVGLAVRQQHHGLLAPGRCGRLGAAGQLVQRHLQAAPQVGLPVGAQLAQALLGLELACSIHGRQRQNQPRGLIKGHHGQPIALGERRGHHLHGALRNAQHREPVGAYVALGIFVGGIRAHGAADVNGHGNVGAGPGPKLLRTGHAHQHVHVVAVGLVHAHMHGGGNAVAVLHNAEGLQGGLCRIRRRATRHSRGRARCRRCRRPNPRPRRASRARRPCPALTTMRTASRSPVTLTRRCRPCRSLCATPTPTARMSWRRRCRRSLGWAVAYSRRRRRLKTMRASTSPTNPRLAPRPGPTPIWTWTVACTPPTPSLAA